MVIETEEGEIEIEIGGGTEIEIGGEIGRDMTGEIVEIGGEGTIGSMIDVIVGSEVCKGCIECLYCTQRMIGKKGWKEGFFFFFS